MSTIGTCLKCQDALLSSETYAFRCGHVFHEECCKRLVRRYNQCPLCHQPAELHHITKLIIPQIGLDDTMATQQVNPAPPTLEYEEMIEKLKKKNKEASNEMKMKDAAIASLKQQMSTLEKKAEKADNLLATNRSLEGMLHGFDATQKELKKVKAKLQASNFYDLLTKNGKGEEEFSKFVNTNGQVVEDSFLKLMHTTKDRLEKQLKASQTNEKSLQKELTEEKQKRAKTKEALNACTERLMKNKEAAKNKMEPPTPNPTTAKAPTRSQSKPRRLLEEKNIKSGLRI